MDTQFEEMRKQMEMLKSKLDKQEIVNEKILRKSMRKNVNNISRRYTALVVVAMLMIPYAYYVFVSMMGYSIGFWIATVVFMLISCGYTVWNGRDLYAGNLMEKSLLVVKQKMALAKKRDNQWMLFGIPMLILWLAYFVYEVYQKGGAEEVHTLLLASAFGGAVGLILGLTIHFKTQREYQEIIDQIEEMEDMEDDQ